MKSLLTSLLLLIACLVYSQGTRINPARLLQGASQSGSILMSGVSGDPYWESGVRWDGTDFLIDGEVAWHEGNLTPFSGDAGDLTNVPSDWGVWSEITTSGIGTNAYYDGTSQVRKLHVSKSNGGTSINGMTAIELEYSGDNKVLNLGSMRSSGNWMMGYAVKPSESIPKAVVSSANNINWNRAWLEMGGTGLHFFGSGAQNVTIDSVVTAPLRFSVSQLGVVTAPGITSTAVDLDMLTIDANGRFYKQDKSTIDISDFDLTNVPSSWNTWTDDGNFLRPTNQEAELRLTSTSGSIIRSRLGTGGAFNWILGDDNQMFGGSNNGDMTAFVYGNNSFHVATNSARRFTVDGLGRVGIGTTSPTTGYMLDVVGNLKNTGNIVSSGIVQSDVLNPQFRTDYRDVPESSSSNIELYNHNYGLFVDNAGTGRDNTRYWVNTPDGGEIIFGPRAGSSYADNFFMRTNRFNLRDSVNNQLVWVSGNLTVNGNEVFHEGNDGAGSGLDADLLDGQQGSYYLDSPWNLNTSTQAINYTAGQAAFGNAPFSGARVDFSPWNPTGKTAFFDLGQNTASFLVAGSTGSRHHIRSEHNPVGQDVLHLGDASVDIAFEDADQVTGLKERITLQYVKRNTTVTAGLEPEDTHLIDNTMNGGKVHNCYCALNGTAGGNIQFRLARQPAVGSTFYSATATMFSGTAGASISVPSWNLTTGDKLFIDVVSASGTNTGLTCTLNLEKQ